MGGKATIRLLDLPDHTLYVYWGDAFFNDLWGRGCHSFGNWIPYAENKFFHSEQQRWVIGEELKLN